MSVNHYCDHLDLANFVGTKVMRELSADSGDADTALIDSLCVEASSFMDGYLGRRYEVPVTNTVALEILRPHACIVARWYLFDRRSAGDMTSSAFAAYQSTERWLQLVAQNKASVPGALPPPVITPVETDAADYGGSETQVYGADGGGMAL